MADQRKEVRAFIAIEIPGFVKSVLERVSGHLQESRADVRWVKPEALHLTLKFLGNMQLDMIPLVSERMEAVLVQERAFDLQVKNLGVFPNPRKPRVVCAGVHDPTAMLPPLADSIETALEPLGFAREGRAFKAHLTLGRVKSTDRAAALNVTITRNSSFATPPFRVDHAVLFQSRLTPVGAHYDALFRCDFRGPAKPLSSVKTTEKPIVPQIHDSQY